MHCAGDPRRPRGRGSGSRPAPARRARGRDDRRVGSNWGAGKLLGSQPNVARGDGLSAAKGRGRHRGRGHVPIAIVNGRDIRDVHDSSHVADDGSVHPPEIFPAVVIPPIIGLVRAQREPRLHADAEGDLRAVDERHERRRIAGRLGQRSRHPAPRRSPENPAAIVERSEPPGLSVDPGPPPGIHPGPMTEAIGHPARRQAGGIPHGPVLR